MHTIQDYVDALNTTSINHIRERGYGDHMLQVFRVEKGGRKYHKVVKEYALTETFQGLSVHSFVDKETGDIFKPAGWRGPAKGARHNLRDLPKIPLDVYGSYLYKW